MRLTLRILSILAIPVALVGAVVVANAVAGLYMVTTQGVAPGEPIWLDELAPSKGDVAVQMTIGGLLVAFALLLRAAIRRKLRS